MRDFTTEYAQREEEYRPAMDKIQLAIAARGDRPLRADPLTPGETRLVLSWLHAVSLHDVADDKNRTPAVKKLVVEEFERDFNAQAPKSKPAASRPAPEPVRERTSSVPPPESGFTRAEAKEVIGAVVDTAVGIAAATLAAKASRFIKRKFGV